MEQNEKFERFMDVSTKFMEKTTQFMEDTNQLLKHLVLKTNQLVATTDELKVTTNELKATTNELKATTDELKVSTDELKVTTNGLKVTTDGLTVKTNGLQGTIDILVAKAIEHDERFDRLEENTATKQDIRNLTDIVENLATTVKNNSQEIAANNYNDQILRTELEKIKEVVAAK